MPAKCGYKSPRGTCGSAPADGRVQCVRHSCDISGCAEGRASDAPSKRCGSCDAMVAKMEPAFAAVRAASGLTATEKEEMCAEMPHLQGGLEAVLVEARDVLVVKKLFRKANSAAQQASGGAGKERVTQGGILEEWRGYIDVPSRPCPQ